jgi:hypothetical protein
MPDLSEPQPSVSTTAPVESTALPQNIFGEASDLGGLQERTIDSPLEEAQLLSLDLAPNGITVEPALVTNPAKNELLEQAKQGKIEALRQLLNHDLAIHSAELADIELRGERLQLSVSGREVPLQDAVEGLIKEWIVQLGLAQVRKVELYGQKEHCELPFWRSEFNPAELELAMPRQKPPEVKPITFAFQKTDSTASTQTETFGNPVRETTSTEQIQLAKETPTTINLEASSAPIENLPPSDAHPEPTERMTNVADKSQSPSFPSLSIEQDRQEMLATPISNPRTEREPLKSEPKQIVENAETASKRKAVEAFVAKYAAGERSFIKIDLSETDLSGINLTLADLQEAQLVWANLQEASLYHVNLLGAKAQNYEALICAGSIF